MRNNIIFLYFAVMFTILQSVTSDSLRYRPQVLLADLQPSKDLIDRIVESRKRQRPVCGVIPVQDHSCEMPTSCKQVLYNTVNKNPETTCHTVWVPMPRATPRSLLSQQKASTTQSRIFQRIFQSTTESYRGVVHVRKNNKLNFDIKMIESTTSSKQPRLTISTMAPYRDGTIDEELVITPRRARN